MSRSAGLGIAAGVFGVLAIIFAMVATNSYNAGYEWRSPRMSGGAMQAADAAAVPTGLAWASLAALVLCVILAVAMRQPRPTK